MEETMLTHLLSNVGIPAAICFYTLFNVNKSIEKLADAFNRLADVIHQRLYHLEHDVRELQRREGSP